MMKEPPSATSIANVSTLLAQASSEAQLPLLYLRLSPFSEFPLPLPPFLGCFERPLGADRESARDRLVDSVRRVAVDGAARDRLVDSVRTVAEDGEGDRGSPLDFAFPP